MFENFCKQLSIHAVPSSYNYQSNRETKACMKKCYETNADIYMALVQRRSMLINLSLPSLGTLFSEDQQEAYCQDSIDSWYCFILITVIFLHLLTAQIKWSDNYLQKYCLSTYRDNCSSTVGRWQTIDISNNHMMCIWWPKWQKLQEKGVQTGHTITSTNNHMNATLYSAKDLLRNKVSKAKQPHWMDRFNELIGYFAQLQKHEHSNEIKTECNKRAKNRPK